MKAGLILIATLASYSLLGQTPLNRVSTYDVASYRYKDAYVKVTYGRPAKKNRDIFGKLVPFGEIWRTGANEATEITLTRDVTILGKLVAAGTYSLFTIPQENQWTIIFNKEVGAWGAYNYNQKLDFARWNVPVTKTQGKALENFTISFENKNNIAILTLCWDDVCTALPIQFNEPKL